MAGATLIIVIGFLLIGAVSLWFFIYAKGWWWAKLLMILVVIGFSLAVWSALDSYLGWPTKEPTPTRFILLWAEIREPEPKLDFAGAIYIWLIPYEKVSTEPGPLEHKPQLGTPRAYELPYSRPVHEQMAKAREIIMGGGTVIMERRRGRSGVGEPGEGDEGEGEEGKNGRRGRGRRGGYGERSYDEFFFYEMPPPVLPDKQ